MGKENKKEKELIKTIMFGEKTTQKTSQRITGVVNFNLAKQIADKVFNTDQWNVETVEYETTKEIHIVAKYSDMSVLNEEQLKAIKEMGILSDINCLIEWEAKEIIVEFEVREVRQ